jgi:hypothetical protein
MVKDNRVSGSLDYARAGSNQSLLDSLYSNMRLRCPENGWWENYEPTIRNIVYSPLLSSCTCDGGDGKGIKLDGDKSFLLDTAPMERFINAGVSEFINTARKMGFNPDVRLHSPSESKTDIGYKPGEVAITLAYAKDEGHTNFLVYTRNVPEKIGKNIPRSVLKRITGMKDLERAAKQGEYNLMGRMARSGIGPFGLKAGDKVYFDASSYEENEKNQDLAPNFSTGFDMLSFNLNLVATRNVMDHLYPHVNVQVRDLWEQSKPGRIVSF